MSGKAYLKYKPSGIEWLREIPEHWETRPVKRRFDIQLGKMLQNNHGSDADLSVPYIKALHVLWGKVDTSDLPEMWASPEDINQFGVRKGDLLVCEGGEAGRACVVDSLPDPCIIQNALHRVRGKGADVRYLQYVLNAVGSGGWFDVLCNKATIAHFTREKLAELRIPLPPSLDEQRSIAAFLDRKIARIDALIKKIEESIDKLREYRTALISAAVTGKIDVREEVNTSQAQRKAPLAFQRAVLAAEIVSRLHSEPTFGRVKFQKTLYLCEHHLEMDLEGKFQRQAAGPFDNRMLRSVESQMEHQKWYAAQKTGQRTAYVPLKNSCGHHKYFKKYWSQYNERLDVLIDLLRPLDTERCEIIATLFAAWNDLIIAGQPFNDFDIIREVRANWHESKTRFDENRLRKALQWMRDKGLVPQGHGKATMRTITKER